MQDKTNSIFGIDLSHYNTVTDWNAVKNAGVAFIYMKATQGTGFVDPQFANYVNGAKSVGIPIGAYHYAGLGDPVSEALHFKNIIDQQQLELIPVLDLEQSASSVDLVEWVKTFKNTLNRKIILYTGNWFIEENPCVNQLYDIPLWTSYYKDTPPPDEPGWKVWTIWQYSDKVSVPGIADLVDVDYGVSLNVISVNGNPPKMEPWLKDALIKAITDLNKKGWINSPDLWINKVHNDEDISGLPVLLFANLVVK